MKKPTQISAVVTDDASPTRLTTTAPSVAPICGMRSKTATTTASANGYASPTITPNTQVLRPATTAIASAPTMYAPTFVRISSVSNWTRVRRLAGTNAYAPDL